jgi:hypothetical protein
MKTLLAAAVLLFVPLGGGAVPPPATPVLVELFTSEGCSSCPPADALLATLAREQPVASARVVALELHVDYWDRLGWKDPFSSAAYTDRQTMYSHVFGEDRVYTPQMVVDGRDEFTGGDRERAAKSIAAAAARPHQPLTVSARVTDRTVRVSIDLPAASANETVDVLAALTEDDLTTAVLRGENRGRTLRHFSVVRKLQTVGSLGSDAFVAQGEWTLEGKWAPAKMHAVVWLQGRKSRHVYAVTSDSLLH